MILEEQIRKNKQLICKYLNITEENLRTPNQTHTSNVAIVSKDLTTYEDTDALILTDEDLGIFLNFADCTPIIFYDNKQNIGAIAHAGWRGTAKSIAKLTAQKLISQFDSKPKNLIAIIGPAISKCCYNVGDEVYLQLKSTVENFEHLYEERNGNIYVDLKNINKQQLLEIGITNIEVCPYCTVCNNENFYSYRKENGTTNRHSAVLGLRK